jgi:DoxX-like family
MRIGMAAVWLWTGFTSWFVFPRDESIAMLARLGIVHFALPLLACASLLDAVLGGLSLLKASRLIWKMQFAVISFYSLAVAIGLPEFLMHPFGPISKNLVLLACIAHLAAVEDR